MIPLTRRECLTAIPLTQRGLLSTLRQRNCQRHPGWENGFCPAYVVLEGMDVGMLTEGRGASAKEAYPQSTRQQVNEKRSGDRSLACKHKGWAATEGAFDA